MLHLSPAQVRKGIGARLLKLSDPQFTQPTFLVQTREELGSAIRHLRFASECAVDMESNSLYSYQERVCLIQVSTSSRNYIFDPIMYSDMSAFGEITANSRIRKYLHGADYDIGSMKRDFGYEFRNIFDTMVAARMLGMPEIGLAALVKHFVGVGLDKKFRKSNWARRPIPPSHFVYLVKDTEYLIEVGHNLGEMLDEVGMMEKARREFRELSNRKPIARVSATSSMWKVKGVRKLERNQLPVFYKLYQWREREARERNLPPFKVMSPKTLLDIAKLPKHNRTTILGVAGVTDLVYQRYGRAILRAAKEGKSFSPKRVPPPPPRGKKK